MNVDLPLTIAIARSIIVVVYMYVIDLFVSLDSLVVYFEISE